MRDMVPPGKRLTIETFQGCERTRGKEGIPYVPDDPFDAALLIPGAYLARAGGKVVVRAQIQEPGMKVDRVAAPFQHCAAQVVVEQYSWKAVPVSEGVHVSTQKALHGLVKEELEVQPSGIRQSDHEAGQLSPGTANRHFPKMSPVDLALFAREVAQD